MQKAVRKDQEKCLGKARTADFSFAMLRIVAQARQVDKIGLAEANALSPHDRGGFRPRGFLHLVAGCAAGNREDVKKTAWPKYSSDFT
jgi:hypothetical protein